MGVIGEMLLEGLTNNHLQGKNPAYENRAL
jgi:hypothetical protein